MENIRNQEFAARVKQWAAERGIIENWPTDADYRARPHVARINLSRMHFGDWRFEKLYPALFRIASQIDPGCLWEAVYDGWERTGYDVHFSTPVEKARFSAYYGNVVAGRPVPPVRPR